MAPRSSGQPAAANKRWLLRQVSLFSNLTDAQLDQVAEQARLVEYEKDDLIYSQGAPADAFYGLISGRVRVYVHHAGEKPETLEVLHRGDYFGTISILTREPHSVTAQAMNDCIVLKIRQPGFEAILRKVPEVAIHLSTTLSRRLRQKDLPPKRVFESTLVSAYSPLPESGLTMYTVNLAASLRKETGKKVILVDLSAGGDAVCRALGVDRCPVPLRLKEGSLHLTDIPAAVVHHPAMGFDTLNVAHDSQTRSDVTQISPLLSYLANLYHFVVIDLPNAMDRTVFKALVQADLIHLICDGTRRQLQATARLMEELQRTVQQADSRIRVVVNERIRDVTEEERSELLQRRIFATLPTVEAPPAPGHPIVLAHPDWPYARAVRRVSREIGEVLVGLVLGSGAAMGLSHIGVLRVLEREKIPVDIIAGSSMGALVGTLWASGFSSRELEGIAGQFRTRRSLVQLADWAVPKFGILAGRQVTRLLTRYLGEKTFRDMKIPMKVIAVDYTRREVMVLDEGPVVQAIRASVSIPAIFEPVRLLGRYLIDGGVLDPVPVDVLTRMEVHKVIAVNTLPSPEDIHRKYEDLTAERERLSQEARAQGRLRTLGFRFRRAWWNWMDTNLFDVIMHTMQGMEYVLAEAQCAQADVVLHPTIPRVNWWELHNVDELIRRGEQEAETHLPEIRKLVWE